MPSVLEAVRVCMAAGAPGITVHPRADARHITAADVREMSAWLPHAGGRVEFNIEGDPRPDLLALVHEVRPTSARSCRCGRARSPARRAGRRTRLARRWPPSCDAAGRRHPRQPVRGSGGRPIRWAAAVGADRVELYTEPFARAFERGDAAGRASFEAYARAAELAASLGLGVNAGHDLDLENLRAVSPAAASGRGLDRPRARQPRAVRGPRPQRPRLPGCRWR